MQSKVILRVLIASLFLTVSGVNGATGEALVEIYDLP